MLKGGKSRALRRCTATEVEEEEDLEERLLNIAWAIGDELGSLIPVVGPIKDGYKALEEGNLRDSCYHVAMLLCDVTPMMLASEAARMAKVSSKVAKLVRNSAKNQEDSRTFRCLKPKNRQK